MPQGLTNALALLLGPQSLQRAIKCKFQQTKTQGLEEVPSDASSNGKLGRCFAEASPDTQPVT